MALILVELFILPHITINFFLQKKGIKRSLKSLFDRNIPFKPGWIWVYLSSYPFIIASTLFFLIRCSNEAVMKIFLTYAFTLIFLSLIWIFYPVKIKRVEKTKLDAIQSKAAMAIKGFQEKFPPYCCFPSTHTCFSLITAVTYFLYFGIWPGLFALIMACLISISTLFTKQHVIKDVAASLPVIIITTVLAYLL